MFRDKVNKIQNYINSNKLQVLAFLLLYVSIFDHTSYNQLLDVNGSYYTFLRIYLFLAFAYLGFAEYYNSKISWSFLLYAILCALYNPIHHLIDSADTYYYVNVLSTLTLIYSSVDITIREHWNNKYSKVIQILWWVSLTILCFCALDSADIIRYF